jgi:flagellar basal-body rod modification protein FlgD
MSQIGQSATASFTAQQQVGQTGGSSDSYNDLDIDSFLKLLISELQNQDPLDPMDNSEMVQQIGQIREIGATDQLTRTLTTLSQSQELVTASSLIGQSVQGLADDASEVDGIVDRITVETSAQNDSRSVKVHVGGKTMDINNIREIQTG